MGAVAIMLAQGAGGGGPPPLPTVTWNSADKGTDVSLSGGNLIATKVTSDGFQSVRATHGHDVMDAGGFYFEVQLTSAGGTAPFALIGVGTAIDPIVASQFTGQGAASYGYYQETGAKYNNNSPTAFGASYTTGDVIGVLVKNGRVYFRKNGTWQNSGDPAAETGFAFSGLTGTVYPAFSPYRASGGTPHVGVGRFSASAFSGSIPAGASAWGA